MPLLSLVAGVMLFRFLSSTSLLRQPHRRPPLPLRFLSELGTTLALHRHNLKPVHLSKMADTMVALRPAVPSVRHHIAPEWDLIIVVDELAPRGTGSAQDRVICTHEFEVSKDALSKIPYFNVAASSKSFADTGKNDFEVKGGDDPAAFDICLRLVHGCLDKTNPEARISTIWNVLVTSRKYGFDALSDELKQWFSAWYATRKENFNTMDCRELLYPCYHFDHAQAFAAVTKRLAYKEVGHIEEHMPELVDAEQKEHRIGNNRVIGESTLRTPTSASLTLLTRLAQWRTRQSEDQTAQ